MVACRCGISLLFSCLTHNSGSFAALTRELSSRTLEEKFHIYVHPCIILYLSGKKTIKQTPRYLLIGERVLQEDYRVHI